MQSLNRMHSQAVAHPRTNRLHRTRSITSMPPGAMVPLAAIPLLREDSLRTGRFRTAFEMGETVELLMNNVNVRVMAYLVPTLAFDRFGGSMDILNRSYMGQPAIEGGSVIPFIETAEFGAHGDNEVYKYLGLHAKPDALVNTAYLEAYNEIWNFRAKNRSPDIDLRDRLQDDLAPAFWMHENFAHIVPDFDQAKIDGEVSLNIKRSDVEVHGLVRAGSADSFPGSAPSDVRTGEPLSVDVANLRSVWVDVTKSTPRVFGELEENGITVSLSNIELARKTQAFARLRERYSQHDDEWIIDMLMGGLSIPDQALKNPMLLAERRAVFGMAKRYATDAGNMTESVVNGVAMVDMALRVPRLATGGVIMIVAEITPEQLFERQKDPYLHANSVEEFPEAVRDFLDPEPVAVVENDFVDIDHDTPNDTFGYAPLNFEWNRNAPTIGGKFYRPEVDAGFDEDRQRFWAVETQNPTLSEDFYLCTNMHRKPFVVTTPEYDPFEAVTVGECVINGNTQFGRMLIEASDDYEKVLEKADQTRIDKDD